MRTPKRKMPQRPHCPICGSPLATEPSDDDYAYTTWHLICTNEECDLLDSITQEEYDKLRKQVEAYEDKTSEVYHDNGEHKLEARWKRWNKEAQLKRTIARLSRIERRKMRQDKLLNLYRSKVSALKFAIKDADAALDHEMENSGFWRQRHDKLLFIAHGYCSASTCGHDIEGS